MNKNIFFPHAHAEPHKGKWRVVLTSENGHQEVVRKGLSRKAAEKIAADMSAK